MGTNQILKELNKDQIKPVLDFEGPSFIVAGPGSGKTHTVVSRSAYMVDQGISPESIMIFTFTNKAAAEIKDRIINKIGEEGRKIKMGTYHSVCASFLRQYADLLGFKRSFTIYDSSDSKNLLRKLCKGLTFDEKRAMEYIGKQKDQMLTPQVAMENAKSNLENDLANIYKNYQDELRAQEALDFDDLLYYTIRLLENHPSVRETLNRKYKYIVADEFHDSSKRDVRFIYLLAGEDQNVCMILDDEQSIYGFRGADLDSVLGVRKLFPSLKTFILSENYRSSQMIVNAARSLIGHNKGQIKKTIFTNNEEGVPAVFFEEYNQDNEGLRVLKLIMLLNRQYNVDFKDIAVLYRSSYLSRSIEDRLLQASIPYKVIGGTPFYARKEIKDIVAYARVIYNPFDFEAFKRVINTPKRGLGDVAVEKIFQYARHTYSQPISFLRACQEIELKGVAAKGINQFNEIIDTLAHHYETDNAADFIHKTVELTEYSKFLYQEESGAQAEDKMANVIELMEIANVFTNMEEFIQTTALQSSTDSEDPEADNNIQLMTQHASKGLEFKAVIIIGANDGISPHWKCTDGKNLEEERRLMYVAMTRAEKYLFFTRSKMMMQNGKTMPMQESRFLKEIDKKFLTRYTNKR
jgi:DNA helicase-2/ATP-dependent DNA helicase PcrA